MNDMLCDTGPLIALIYEDDPDPLFRLSILTRVRSPLLTTWPCITEAMHLLGRKSGAVGQDELWGYIEDGVLQIHDPSEEERKRMRTLMKRYRDFKRNRLMDLGDASLVAAAETLSINRIFTLDSDFHYYRINGDTPFDVIS